MLVDLFKRRAQRPDYRHMVDLTPQENQALDTLGTQLAFADSRLSYVFKTYIAMGIGGMVSVTPQGYMAMRYALYTPIEDGGYERLPRISFAWNRGMVNDDKDCAIRIDFVPAYIVENEPSAEPNAMVPRVLRVQRDASGRIAVNESETICPPMHRVLELAAEYEAARSQLSLDLAPKGP